MRQDSLGRRLLLRVIGQKGSVSAVAAELGVGQPMVSRWAAEDVRQRRCPDAKRRGLLERAYGIPWQAWDEPPDDGDAAHGSAA